MKKIIIGLALVAAGISAHAQSPVPRGDSVRNPIKQGDPALESMPEQAGYTKDMVKIKPGDLPAGVRKSLSGTTYKGWEQAHLYRNKTSTEYVVEFQDPLKTRVYKFDKSGKESKSETKRDN